MLAMDVDVARDPDDAAGFEVQDGLRGIGLASVIGNAHMLKMEASAIPNRCRGRVLMGMKKVPIPQVEKATRNDKRPVLRGIVAASRRHDFPARHRQRPAATDMERRVSVDGSAVALQKRRAAGDGERLCNPQSANVVRPVCTRIEDGGSCRVVHQQESWLRIFARERPLDGQGRTTVVGADLSRDAIADAEVAVRVKQHAAAMAYERGGSRV